MDATPFGALDALSSVLHFVRITGTFYCRSELSAPWGLFMPPMQGCMWFHNVVEGETLIDVDGAPPTRAPAGTFVLVPHGRGHRLRSGPNVATPNVVGLPHDHESERYALLRHGGGGARTVVVCGVVRLEPPVGPELERMLPASITLDRESQGAGSLAGVLAALSAEARDLRAGGETVITRLADVLVIQAIRGWLERDHEARRGWLVAMRDPQVGRVLADVWRAPSEPWTVARMATRAAMSRSAFASRFAELVGESPMLHVSRIRMHLAAASLREGRASIAELSSRLGYRSEAAFARAFKRVVGAPPGALRRGAGVDVRAEG